MKKIIIAGYSARRMSAALNYLAKSVEGSVVAFNSVVTASEKFKKVRNKYNS